MFNINLRNVSICLNTKNPNSKPRLSCLYWAQSDSNGKCLTHSSQMRDMLSVERAKRNLPCGSVAERGAVGRSFSPHASSLYSSLVPPAEEESSSGSLFVLGSESSCEDSALLRGSHVILFSFFNRRRALANHVDT